MAQIEVITGTARRRVYTEEQKRALLAEAFAPGVCVRDFLRQHDIPTSSLYKWRQQLADTVPCPKTAPAGTGTAFTQVVTVPEMRPSVIELEVGSSRVRIPGSITPELAAAIVRTLVRR